MSHAKAFLSIIALFLSLFSCKGEQKESVPLQGISFNFKFKTFVEVKKHGGEFIIYKPCDGFIRKLKWNKNEELEIIEIVENLKKKISKYEQFSDGFRIYYGNQEYYDFRIFDKKKGVFKVTCNRKANFANETWGVPPFVINSELSKTFRTIKQPCIECYTEEQCISIGEIPPKKKITKNYDVSEYLIRKESKILLEGKKIQISIPFIIGHVDLKGNAVWGKNEISSNLVVKKIRGQKGSLLSVDGEGKCGACPNFSAFYSIDGELLCYAYSVRVSTYKAKTLLKEGDFKRVMTDYGITSKDLNIQYNHPDTTTYIIKDWY